MEIRLEDKTIQTKFNIGDRVHLTEQVWTKGKKGRPICETKIQTSSFYLDEKDSDGNNLTEKRPLVYEIEDISMSCRSGCYTYKLKYHDERCMFPSGYVGAVDECKLIKV